MAEARLWRLHGGEPVLWTTTSSAGLPCAPTDLRGARTLRLDIDSFRRTGARLRVDLLSGESCLGHFTFAADWEGENTMLMPLATLSSPSAPDRPPMPATALRPEVSPATWPPVTGIRFTETSVGVWPSTFAIRSVEALDVEAAWPVDDGDLVIEAGWHDRFARADLWRFVAGTPAVTRPWPWLKFQVKQVAEPARIVVERDFDVDLTGATELLSRFNWDGHSALSVEALVDGSWISVAERVRWVPAVGEMHTLGTPLRGRSRLERVRITLAEGESSPRDGRPVGFGLFWLLVRYATRRDARQPNRVLVRTRPCADSPDGSPVTRSVPGVEALTPLPSRPTEIRESLPLGFFLRRETVQSIKATPRTGPLAGVVAALREEADRALESDLVERNAAGSAWGGGVGLPKGYNGSGIREYAPAAAFAWLVTGEWRYAEACKRWLLRAAVSRCWIGDDSGPADRPAAGDRHFYDDAFTTSHPKGFGGYMDHAFFVGSAAWGVAVAADMLWGCLDDNERRIVLDGMARNGVYILYDKLRHARDFYVGQNQGVIYGCPLLMLATFLRDRDPAYRAIQEWTLAFLRDMGTHEWNTEGVCSESPGYSFWTAGMYAEAIPVMAACSGEPVSSFITPNLRAVMNTLLHYTSTWREEVPGFDWPVGMYWGDSSGWVSPSYLAMMASACDDAAAAWCWELRYRDHRQPDPSLLVYAQGWPAPRSPELPPAWRTVEQPQLFFRTGSTTHDSIVAVHNMRSRVDHAHADRGSVVFEFQGEPLLRDPGMVNYGDTASGQYKESFCHTLPTFSGKGQVLEAPSQGELVPAYLSTSGDRCPGIEGGIDWATLDLGFVYPDAERAIRHVVFLRPDVLVLFDDLVAREEETIELNYTCTGPLHAAGGGWVSESKRNRLALVTAADRELAWKTLPWGSHWPELPTWRLVGSTTTTARSLRAITVAAAAPLAARPPEAAPLLFAGCVGLSATTVRGEILALWGARIPESMGVGTDGSMLVVRLTQGRVVGAAAYGATRIDYQGGRLCSSPSPALIGAVVRS